MTATSTVSAGAAKVAISVQADRLAGYALRDDSCSGVHDPLYARVTVFDDGRTTVAIVVLDLLYIPAVLAQQIRERVAARLGTPADNILINATHTHSGPADLAISDTVQRAIAAAADEAAGLARSSAVPAVLATGTREVGGISAERRTPAGRPDATARILVALTDDSRRSAIATIVNFACHATVLDHTWTALSADFPGAACAQIENAIGGTAFYLQGCAGNINPVFTEPSWPECERIGALLSAAACSVAHQARGAAAGLRTVSPSLRDEFDAGHLADCRIVTDPQLSVQWSSTAVPPADALPTPATIAAERRALAASLDSGAAGERRTAAMRDAQLWIQELRSNDANLFGVFDPGPPARLEVQLLTLAPDLHVLALPGEPFAETGAAIRSASGGEVLIAGYAHQSVGYLPPATAWDEGGYEVGCCLYADSVESQLRQCAVDLLGAKGANIHGYH